VDTRQISAEELARVARRVTEAEAATAPAVGGRKERS